MDPNTTAAVRDIFVIVAAGAFAVLCITVVAVVFKLYRPLRETVANVARTSENLSQITTDLSAVSEETSGNVAETSRNAVIISENLKQGSEDLSNTVRTAGGTAKSVGAAADSVKEIADIVGRMGSMGIAGGGTSGVAPLLRIVRGLFGGSRRKNDGGVQQDS